MRHQSIDKAVKSIEAAMATSSNAETKDGLEKALLLIERAIPDLEVALSSTVSALDDASTVVDKSEDEDYAYQAEIEGGRAAMHRIANVAYEPAGAKIVCRTMTNEGKDPLAVHIIVCGLAEGFSRAAGNPSGTPERFERLPLPAGLTSELLYAESSRLFSGDELDGLTIVKMEKRCLDLGKEFYTEVTRAATAAPGL